MKNKNLIIPIILISILGFGVWGFYTFFFKEKKPKLFTTESIPYRDIEQIVKATGFLEPKERMKIGSLVRGIIEKMMVEENDLVKKGDLLVLVDDGKGDTEVRQTKAALEQAKAKLTYQTAFYKRQQALYAKHHISQNRFEEVTKDYVNAQEEVQLKQALYDKAVLDFNNKKIKSPGDGIVVSKIGRKGETVSLTSPPTIIYTIAKDLREMKAQLEIDESVVGNLKINMIAQMTFDTYPDKIFTGQIVKISNAARKEKDAIIYLAQVPLANKKLLFRPSMTVHAKITIAKKEDVMAVPSNIFNINRKMLKRIAKMKNYQYKKLDSRKFEECRKKYYLKTVWIFQNNAFIEKAVGIGINDNAYFEIVSGLKGNEQLVVDTIEPDLMEKFFERYFGKGL